MTSEPTLAFVWSWLPGAPDPVVAGRLDLAGEQLVFTYGRTYLDREDAVALYEPELALRRGTIAPLAGDIPGVISDAGPDAWGQRVILNRRVGRDAYDTADRGPLTYLLESGSDRIGALDFQASPRRYVARDAGQATLEELATSAERVEQGVALSDALDRALLHGSSIGGARPKALLRDGDRHLIAKFSSSDDPHPVVKGEFVAMTLAARAGLDVAPVRIERALGRDVLLVDRFDRAGGGRRRGMVSALTMLELGELEGRYAGYWQLADLIRRRFTRPRETLRELFARLVFNVLTGNTDDHARNHAAFWDGRDLSLTPAYDICPQRRGGNIQSQAMEIGPDGWKTSNLAGCIDRAGAFMLSAEEARDVVDHQVRVIETDWEAVCDDGGLTDVQRRSFRGRQFLNPSVFDGL